jgi:hypothetical protein
MGSHYRSILVHYSFNRRPEDGGLKTPKYVASLIDINNKEIKLCWTEYCVILKYVTLTSVFFPCMHENKLTKLLFYVYVSHTLVYAMKFTIPTKMSVRHILYFSIKLLQNVRVREVKLKVCKPCCPYMVSNIIKIDIRPVHCSKFRENYSLWRKQD